MPDEFLGTLRCPMGAYVASDGNVQVDRYTTDEERTTRKDKAAELVRLEESRVRCAKVCKVFRASPKTLKVICPVHEVVWANEDIWAKEIAP
jgi:hypothetical protein